MISTLHSFEMKDRSFWFKKNYHLLFHLSCLSKTLESVSAAKPK